MLISAPDSSSAENFDGQIRGLRAESNRVGEISRRPADLKDAWLACLRVGEQSAKIEIMSEDDPIAIPCEPGHDYSASVARGFPSELQ